MKAFFLSLVMWNLWAWGLAIVMLTDLVLDGIGMILAAIFLQLERPRAPV